MVTQSNDETGKSDRSPSVGADGAAIGNQSEAAKNSGNVGSPRSVNIGQGRAAGGNGKPRRGAPTKEEREARRAAAEQAATNVHVKAPSKPIDIDGLTLMLANTCAILAGIAKTPELELDDDEAKQVAAAYANVARHYNWVPNEKAADWYNLVTVCGAVFGSKIVGYQMRKNAERKQRVPQPAQSQPPRHATPSQPQPSHAEAPQPRTPLQSVPVQSMPAAEPDYADAANEG